MTEMVALIYLRYLLKVAQIIIPENPLCLYFICTTNSLTSALPLCQLYSPEQTVNISFVFLGWTLPGTDLPQLFQPTANTEGISKSHLEILVSHKLSQPLWGLVFPFFLLVLGVTNAQNIQTPIAINAQLPTLHKQGVRQRKVQGKLRAY